MSLQEGPNPLYFTLQFSASGIILTLLKMTALTIIPYTYTPTRIRRMRLNAIPVKTARSSDNDCILQKSDKGHGAKVHGLHHKDDDAYLPSTEEILPYTFKKENSVKGGQSPGGRLQVDRPALDDNRRSTDLSTIHDGLSGSQENELNEHGNVGYETTHISAGHEGPQNGIGWRSPLFPRRKGGFDIGAEQDFLFTNEPSTFSSVGSPTRSLHSSSMPPQSPTGQESHHHYIGRGESKFDEEEQQEKENDNAHIPDNDCINIKCNEVNGSLRRAESV
jgi:hypothetical protein